MNIVIIEDEKITADELAGTIIALEPDANIVAILSSVKMAVAYFQSNRTPDLIFSDVQLGDGLSFEIFKACKISAPVIFCTAYDEYALNAFKTNSIDYILKPSTSQTVADALAKYRSLRQTFSDGGHQYKAVLDALINRDAPKSTSILVYQKDKILPIRLEKIALFYIADEVTHLITFDTKTYVVNKNLEELEQLSGNDFFRVNRQYLINRKAVIDASRYFLRKLSVNISVPYNKEKILVSKEKIPQFLAWLESMYESFNTIYQIIKEPLIRALFVYNSSSSVNQTGENSPQETNVSPPILSVSDTFYLCCTAKRIIFAPSIKNSKDMKRARLANKNYLQVPAITIKSYSQMKLFYLACSMCATALLASCGTKQKEPATNEASRLIKVIAETIQSTKVSSNLHYSGTIEPQQTIPLTFEGVGTVERVLVQAGDMVRKGQVLATIDKADDIAINGATVAKYKQAKDAYNRLKSVYEKGSLPEIKWVEIETNLKEAESQMQLSKSSIRKCTMRAPTDGMIGKRNIEPGQNSVSLRAPIELVKIETILVKISVAENEISWIKKGQKAIFTISALNGRSFEGVVSNVGIVADEISRTYEVKIKTKNPDYEIKPGMVCDVNLNTNIEKDLLYISKNAVSKDGDDKNYVYVVSPDKKHVTKQEVILGYYNETGIEVVSGLTAGQTVVVEGKEKLSNNSLIRL